MTLAHGTDRIESQRLVLRRITKDDLPFYTRIHANPRVAQYLSHGLPRTAEESLDWLRFTLAAYTDFELGQLAVVRKEDGRLLGRCGTGDFAVESAAAPGTILRGWYNRAQGPAGVPFDIEPELGYTFDDAYWGNGYASEAARCVFDYLRTVRRLPHVVSIIHPDNVRSQKVAERFSLRREGSVEVAGRVFDRYLWPMQA
jgi:ribosomal-protein-alanine N-acetyltransferase